MNGYIRIRFLAGREGEGWQKVEDGVVTVLLDAAGEPVANFLGEYEVLDGTLLSELPSQ